MGPSDDFRTLPIAFLFPLCFNKGMEKEVMFPEKTDYKSGHVILDRQTHENDLKDFSFTFLELLKFNLKLDELRNIMDKWMYFFIHARETGEADLTMKKSADMKAFQPLKLAIILNWNVLVLLL